MAGLTLAKFGWCVKQPAPGVVVSFDLGFSAPCSGTGTPSSPQARRGNDPGWANCGGDRGDSRLPVHPEPPRCASRQLSSFSPLGCRSGEPRRLRPSARQTCEPSNWPHPSVAACSRGHARPQQKFSTHIASAGDACAHERMRRGCHLASGVQARAGASAPCRPGAARAPSGLGCFG